MIGKLGNLFRKKAPEAPAAEAPKDAERKLTCKGCGKQFAPDPTLGFVPNYCRECRKKIDAEREAKQRAGAPREIRRKCKACGKYFTFPNTAEHYPVYCGACRKQQRAEKKAKYSRKPAQDNKPEE